jgi:prophage antirepressor-like protein
MDTAMNEQNFFDFLQYDIQPEVYDDVPWYVAADVCRILGLQNPAVAVSRLDDGDVMLKPHMTAGGLQKCLRA